MPFHNKINIFLKDIKDCHVFIFFAVFGVVPSTAVADAIGLRVMIYYCVKSCFALKLEEIKKKKRKTLRSEFLFVLSVSDENYRLFNVFD